MRITERGLNLIKAFEQFSPTVYRCAGGYETIGYGHVIQKHERTRFKDGIDEATALTLLEHDVKIAEHAVTWLVSAPLTEGQFDALTSFTFNLGSGTFQRSTLRAKVNRQDPHAYQEFAKYVYAGGRKLRGLTLRRDAEARLYCI